MPGNTPAGCRRQWKQADPSGLVIDHFEASQGVFLGVTGSTCINLDRERVHHLKQQQSGSRPSSHAPSQSLSRDHAASYRSLRLLALPCSCHRGVGSAVSTSKLACGRASPDRVLAPHLSPGQSSPNLHCLNLGCVPSRFHGVDYNSSAGGYRKPQKTMFEPLGGNCAGCPYWFPVVSAWS